MRRFIMRRLLQTLPLLLLLSLLTFGLFQLIPGDYLAEMMLNPTVSAESVEQLRIRFGLDEPLLVQYGKWLVAVCQLDFGYSFAQRRPAIDLIGERLTNTLLLTGGALALILLLAFPIGTGTALMVGTWWDRIGLWLSLAGLSLPTVLAAVLMLYLAFWTGWFPVGAESWRDLFLPSLTLALPAVAFLVRTIRLEMVEALQQPYVVAAAAKGLPPYRVVYHALRNALNPVISLLGVLLGGLLSGAVVVEKVFRWPGLGALIVDSILSRDLYVALNCVLVSALLVIVANLLADLLLAWNDPRVRGL
jgi:peptide/nickel transport system permease protein